MTLAALFSRADGADAPCAVRAAEVETKNTHGGAGHQQDQRWKCVRKQKKAFRRVRRRRCCLRRGPQRGFGRLPEDDNLSFVART